MYFVRRVLRSYWNIVDATERAAGSLKRYVSELALNSTYCIGCCLNNCAAMCRLIRRNRLRKAVVVLLHHTFNVASEVGVCHYAPQHKR